MANLHRCKLVQQASTFTNSITQRVHHGVILSSKTFVIELASTLISSLLQLCCLANTRPSLKAHNPAANIEHKPYVALETHQKISDVGLCLALIAFPSISTTPSNYQCGSPISSHAAAFPSISTTPSILIIMAPKGGGFQRTNFSIDPLNGLVFMDSEKPFCCLGQNTLRSAKSWLKWLDMEIESKWCLF